MAKKIKCMAIQFSVYLAVSFSLQVEEVPVTYKFKIKLNAHGKTGIDCNIVFVENLLCSLWDAEVLSC